MFLVGSQKPRSAILLWLGSAVTGNIAGEFLDQNEFGSPSRPAPYRELIHERPHQEKPAPRCAQQVLLSKAIGHLGRLEAFSFVNDAEYHSFGLKFDGHTNLLPAVLLVAVIVRVDHTFAHGHADLVNILVAETGSLRDTHGDAFGKVHALEQCLERQFEALGCDRHMDPGSRTIPAKNPVSLS